MLHRYVAGAAALLALTIALRCRTDDGARERRVAIRAHCGQDCGAVENLALDIWSEHRHIGDPLDVVVSSRDLSRLSRAGLRWEILVDDIDAVARAEAARLRATAEIQANAQPADWFREYRDYRAISARLGELAEHAPELASVEAIGSSLESRPIYALRIGGKAAGATPVLINGTQHAREWISSMVTTCIADRLVRGYGVDPAIRDFVDRTELWVVPVVNPDGYQYAWSGNRYWRKNRRGNHGVDLNRNWDLAWGGAGSSGNRFSDVYRGASPFSEPETAAVRDLARREQIALHVDFHAFGQLLLYPWSYQAKPSPDEGLFRAVGDRMASAMFSAHERRYALMSSIELYPAAGTMTDYMYGAAKALSYTIELRPSRGGRSGFVLPPEEIQPTCDEAMAALFQLRAARN